MTPPRYDKLLPLVLLSLACSVPALPALAGQCANGRYVDMASECNAPTAPPSNTTTYTPRRSAPPVVYTPSPPVAVPTSNPNQAAAVAIAGMLGNVLANIITQSMQSQSADNPPSSQPAPAPAPSTLGDVVCKEPSEVPADFLAPGTTCRVLVNNLGGQQSFANATAGFNMIASGAGAAPDDGLPPLCHGFYNPELIYQPESEVCVSGLVYRCKSQTMHWVHVGSCASYAADARETEMSHFNTNVYEDDNGGRQPDPDQNDNDGG